MGYCEIFTMNPVTKIEQKDNQWILHATHNMHVDYGDISFMSSLIDDMQKHVIFTDTEKDFDLMDLSLSRVSVLIECELKEMRTITDLSFTDQDIRFILNAFPINHNTSAINRLGAPMGKCAIYPKILLYNGETKDATLFFYVENIQKTRRKKLQKIIKKKNVMS